MNKYNYLNALSNIIQNELPADEYNDVMQYYSEYFADAGPEKEQEVMEALGTPEELAVGIIAEQRGKQADEVVVRTKRKGLPLGWIIAIAIVGSPIWLALFCVAVSLAACAFALVVSLAAVAVSFVIGGVVLIVGGIGRLFSVPAEGIAVIGGGFLTEAVGIAVTMLGIFLTRLISKGVKASRAKKKARRIKQ
ncbi:MAG: DUF1700 domain-containing protein [Butyrivibrio sp.]|nr:DUF1700 domain-containing protein [Butyrivibrio sp.]